MGEPSPYLHPYSISVCKLTTDALCRVKADGFNSSHILNWCWIDSHMGQKNWYEFVCLWFLQTQPHVTTYWSRCYFQHMQLSTDDFRSVRMLSKCCRGRCGCSHVYLVFNNDRNVQFSSPILYISLTEILGCVPPSGLCQLVKPHLRLPNTLHAVLYCFSDCAHHPARFSIITQIAKLCIFLIIFLVFHIAFIVETCKIPQTVSDSIQHVFEECFGLSGCRPRTFSSSHIF